MSQYAWSNPTTGLREKADTPERARHILWIELQETAIDSWPVYEIEMTAAIGRGDLIDPGLREGFLWFAWTSPANGQLVISTNYPETITECIAREFASLPEGDPTETVIIYSARTAFTVQREESQPDIPAPPEYKMDPEMLIKQINEGSCPDLQQASAIALLWIAQELQAVGRDGLITTPRRPSTTRRNPHGPRRRHYRPGLLFRLIAWWHSLWQKVAKEEQFWTCANCGEHRVDAPESICLHCAAASAARALRDSKTQELPEMTEKQREDYRARMVRNRAPISRPKEETE